MDDFKPASAIPRTARDALIAEMLGDIDTMLSRIEATNLTVQTTAGALDTASENYRSVVIEFTEQAKKEIAASVERTISKTNEEERSAMQEAARIAFRSEASDKAFDLARALTNVAKDFQQSRLTRWIESAIIASASSLVTALIVVWFLKK